MITPGEALGIIVIFGLPAAAIIIAFYLLVFGLTIGPRAWNAVVERRLEETKLADVETDAKKD